MKVLINFANENFRKQQAYNTKTGYSVGKFDKVIEYSPKDIDEEFYKKNEDILKIERGCGLWLWKPYFILKTLNELNEGDYLFYCDSGAYFLSSIDNLISVMERDHTDVMCYEIPLLEYEWTSKRCIDGMKCNSPEYLYTPQREGGFILLKNTPFAKSIIAEFLHLCENKDLLIGDELGDQCITHREDQSIWSLLTKKYKIKSYREPSQYGFLPRMFIRYSIARTGVANVCFTDHSDSSYPIIVYLYRKEAHYKFIPRVISRLRLMRAMYFNNKL